MKILHTVCLSWLSVKIRERIVDTGRWKYDS